MLILAATTALGCKCENHSALDEVEVRTSSIARIANVRMSDVSGCAVSDVGGVTCWGSREFDSPPGPWSVVEPGTNYVVGILQDGTAQAWGDEPEAVPEI